MRWLLILLLLSPLVFADCYRPSDFEHINASVTFCSDTFDAPNGIYLTTSNIAVDCNSAVIRGNKGESNNGIILEDVTNVIQTLPPDLRELANSLKSQSISEVARRSGVPRTTLNDRVRRIRTVFDKAGLRAYRNPRHRIARLRTW